jgi:hypothetical protein
VVILTGYFRAGLGLTNPPSGELKPPPRNKTTGAPCHGGRRARILVMDQGRIAEHPARTLATFAVARRLCPHGM